MPPLDLLSTAKDVTKLREAAFNVTLRTVDAAIMFDVQLKEK